VTGDSGHLLRETNLPPPTGLLLVGHGTRSAAGIQQFLEISAVLSVAVPEAIVEPAFLELAQPDIGAAVSQLASRGAGTIVVVPFLLAAADHVKSDIPEAVRTAVVGIGENRPKLIFAEHLGAHANVIELSQLRYREALENLSPAPPETTCHLLVGRGTHDPSAIAEVRRFAELRADPSSAAQTRVAFLAMARPSLAEELQRIAIEPFARVVVQPHLLFAGELAVSIERQVATLAGRPEATQWLTTDVLADPDGKPQRGAELLAVAAYERFAAVIRVVGREGDG
jgi:sirohydrochlorin cobaltochelatase